MANGIEVLGVDAVNKMLEGVPMKAQTAARRGVAKLTREARDEVKAATPVDEGDLKRAIAVKGARPKKNKVSYAVIARQNGGKSGSGAHYHFVEDGTVKMAARRFAAPIRQKYTGAGGAMRLESAISAVIQDAVIKQANKGV